MSDINLNRSYDDICGDVEHLNSKDIVSTLAIAAGVTNTITAADRVMIDVSKVDSFDLFTTITPDAGYSGSLEFTFEVSTDGANWYEDTGDTAIMESITSGDTQARVSVYVGSLPYVRIEKIKNNDPTYGITINKLVALIKS